MGTADSAGLGKEKPAVTNDSEQKLVHILEDVRVTELSSFANSSKLKIAWPLLQFIVAVIR